MKKLFCILVILAISDTSFAQWATSGNNTIHTNTGNIGIGTNTPNATLDLGGSLQLSAENSTSPPSGVSYGLFHYGGVGLGLFSGATAPSQGIGIWTNPGGQKTEVIRILSNGRTGIGTTAPLEPLHVNGNIALAAAVNSSNTYLSFQRPSDGYIGARVGNVYAMNGYQGYLVFETNNGGGPTSTTEQMRILSNGNIAIGTTDPKGYKLAVAGGIVSESVTVKLQSQWPDYVFKPTYKLPSLATIKSYVDKNKHLPDMPSEAEVAENGINLGEVVKLQTKKIEELTLYLIEQNKQLKKQQVQIKYLLNNTKNKNL